MANNALAKITARAKQIQRANPKKKWVDCVKAASAEYRSKKKAAPKKKAGRKVSGTKSKAAPKKTVIKKAKTVVIAGPKKRKKSIKTPFGTFSIGSIAHSKLGAEVAARDRYKRELQKAIERKAPMKEKAAIRKLIATTNKNITNLKRSI